MRVNISPRLQRSYQKLPADIQIDFDAKLPIFLDDPHDRRLKTHKLRGVLESCQAFSLARGYRVLFEYTKPDLANLLDIGPHDKYRQWQR